MPLREGVEFILLGFVLGVYGTFVGAGGGVILVPILLLVFHYTPQQAAGTSLAVVCANALSATLAYLRQRRVDLQTGWRFAVATVPSGFAGAQVAALVPAGPFRAVFGLLLLALALFLNLRPERPQALHSSAGAGPLPPGWVRRTLVDARGERFQYAFNLRGGVLLSVGIGFLATVLGIGGGVVHVPAMVLLFGFPAHLATATSTFVLTFTALAGALPYLARGEVLTGPAVAMAAGVIGGAQVGAVLARGAGGRLIVRLLSLTLVAIGLRLLASAF